MEKKKSDGQHAISVRKVAQANFPSRHGTFKIVAFVSNDGKEHVALVKDGAREKPPLVRLHSECLTGDALGSKRCDCGRQLQSALGMIAKNGSGALLYLSQEGRGIGLANKIRAYALQDKGRDTVQANIELGFGADERDFAFAACMLRRLGFEKIRLITNNPQKVRALEENGIEVVQRVAHKAFRTRENAKYLRTKKEKMGHLLDV